MSLVRRHYVWCGLLLLSGLGCAHMMESRAIEKFAESLAQEDLKLLRETTSPGFSDRALRTSEAMEDLKILRLPDGKTSVVEVEEIDDRHRRVTVEVGEQKREVFYELTKQEDGRWVVDEVFLKQKRKGVEAFKSVSEQMNLLLTVREFLDAWQGDDREKALSITTATFRKHLEALPPSHLAKLTQHVVGSRPATGVQKPQASLDEKAAVVRLPRLDGETILTLVLNGQRWQVEDIAVDAKAEENRIPSVMKQAMAINACTKFLAAYEAKDKSALQELATPAFYEGSLAVGQLDRVQLPSAQLPEHSLKVKLQPTRADFILESDFEIVQVNMRREDAEQLDKPPVFSVADVTIYDMETRQEMRLSALFTAQAMLDIFVQSMANQDLTHLRHCSTRDFTQRVWEQLDDATIKSLPMTVFETGKYQVVDTQFQGSLTKMRVDQNGHALTYLMRQEGGRFYVDDVLWDLPGHPESMKTTMELLVPVHQFAAAIALGRDGTAQKAALEQLQKSASTDFNRMVWQQTAFVPNSGYSADTFLKAPLVSVMHAEKQATLQFGDSQFGASVQLVKEFEHWAVNEINLVAGPTPEDRMGLKQTLKTAMAQGDTRPPEGYAASPRSVMLIKHEEPDSAPPKGPITITAPKSVDEFGEEPLPEEVPFPAENSESPQEVWADEDVIPIPTQADPIEVGLPQ